MKITFDGLKTTAIFTKLFQQELNMKSLSHLIGVSAILMLAFTFTNCTTDSEVTQIPESELESEDIDSSSSAEKAETKAKSSSSKKEEAKSSESKKSSASKDEEKKDSDTDKSSSSSVKKDSEDKVSSSSKKEEAKSSSSARKISVPGMDEDEEIVKKDSTSKKSSSSSAKKPKEKSSSSSNIAKDTVKTDTTTVITDKDKENNMEKLDSAEQQEIQDLIDSGDTTITQIDSPDKVESDSLDFDNNDYYCKTPDGSWYRLKENKAKTFWKLLWDFTVYIFTGRHYYDFTKVCEELYMRPKN